MGIANMAYYNGELGAALRYNEILDRMAAIGWGNYILWWIVLMIVLIIAWFIIAIIGGILMFILIGILVYIFGIAYLVMFQARSVALTFASSGEYEAVEESPEEEKPVE
jgi:DNA integrity scanning protein DisA with diadenylate cyclase activity